MCQKTEITLCMGSSFRGRSFHRASAGSQEVFFMKRILFSMGFLFHIFSFGITAQAQPASVRGSRSKSRKGDNGWISQQPSVWPPRSCAARPETEYRSDKKLRNCLRDGYFAWCQDARSGLLQHGLCYARLKQTDKAFEMLGKAIDEGYVNRESYEKDEDLAEIRKDARFGQLISRFPAATN